MDESLSPLDQLRATERRAALGTLVAAKGTTPKKEGAKVWVGEGGRIHGSVTIGGCVDARATVDLPLARRRGRVGDRPDVRRGRGRARRARGAGRRRRPGRRLVRAGPGGGQ